MRRSGSIKPLTFVDMTDDSEPQMTTLNFPLFWDKQDEGGEPPTAGMFAGSSG
jgi:hypothetical protein